MDFSLGGLFKKENTSVLGLDIGSSSIKVVQLKKKGSKAVLETYGELSLGPYAEAAIGQSTKLPADVVAKAMIDLLNEKEVNLTTRNCGIAIPFHASLLTVIQMPAVKEKDLAAMVPIEARKYIPVPISEVTLDWSIIPKVQTKNDDIEVSMGLDKKKEDKTTYETLDVLLAAIHNNILSEFREVVANAGLSASFFEIELFSAMRSVLDEDVHSAMIVDMGAASTKLYIVERGVLRSSHIINKGGQDITANIARLNSITFEEAEVLKRNSGALGSDTASKEAATLTFDYIFSEANRVLFSYENQSKVNVEKIILIGGGASLKGLPEIASQSLKTTVVPGDPFRKTETPAFLEEVLSQTGPEFAVAVGVALRKLSEME